LGQISGTGNFQTQVTVRRTCCGNCSEGLTSDKKQTAENSRLSMMKTRPCADSAKTRHRPRSKISLVNQSINQKFKVNSAEHCSDGTEKTKDEEKKEKRDVSW